jgi:hypothetical protein
MNFLLEKCAAGEGLRLLDAQQQGGGNDELGGHVGVLVPEGGEYLWQYWRSLFVIMWFPSWRMVQRWRVSWLISGLSWHIRRVGAELDDAAGE